MEWLRKKGLARAAQKADRVAQEGLIQVATTGDRVVMVEVNCETDFVGRNQTFRDFVRQLAEWVAQKGRVGMDVSEILEMPSPQGIPVREWIQQLIATLGENVVLRRAVVWSHEPLVTSYIHGDGRIGVLLKLKTDKVDENVRQLAFDLCLQIAAMNPLAVSPQQLPESLVNKERDILRAKALEQGKKPEMIDRIVEGQLRKFYQESCLLEQSFVKSPDLTVKEYMDQVGRSSGASLVVESFIRWALGQAPEYHA